MRATYLRGNAPKQRLYDRVLDDTGCDSDLQLMGWMLSRGLAPIALYFAFVTVLKIFV